MLTPRENFRSSDLAPVMTTSLSLIPGIKFCFLPSSFFLHISSAVLCFLGIIVPGSYVLQQILWLPYQRERDTEAAKCLLAARAMPTRSSDKRLRKYANLAAAATSARV